MVGETSSSPRPAILSVVPMQPGDLWAEVYAADGAAVPSLSPEWAKCVVDVGHYRNVSVCFTFPDGMRAVLPMFESRTVGLKRWWSPPAAWGFGGVISTAPLQPGHVEAVLSWLQRQPGQTFHVRPNPLQAEVWKSGMPAAWTAINREAHVLDLSGGYERVWSERFKSDTRNKVRRAERAGLEIESGSDEAIVTQFHGLLVESFGRWAKKQREPAALARWRGLRRDPLAKFLGIAAGAPSLFRIWVAKSEGRAVAAILVLRDKQAHYTRGAMIEDLAGPVFANYLLHARAIEDACRAGCQSYHMGETGASKSLAQFKSRFGAEPVPYQEYQYEKIPLNRTTRAVKTVIKKAIGFKDA